MDGNAHVLSFHHYIDKMCFWLIRTQRITVSLYVVHHVEKWLTIQPNDWDIPLKQENAFW